jgi:hypothetical protein
LGKAPRGITGVEGRSHNLMPGDSIEELVDRIEKLQNEQSLAIQDAVYVGMTPKVAKKCTDRREVISKLVDRLKKEEEGREVISEILDRLAGLTY